MMEQHSTRSFVGNERNNADGGVLLDVAGWCCFQLDFWLCPEVLKLWLCNYITKMWDICVSWILCRLILIVFITRKCFVLHTSSNMLIFLFQSYVRACPICTCIPWAGPLSEDVFVTLAGKLGSCLQIWSCMALWSFHPK
jgi:hypothetical protein